MGHGPTTRAAEEHGVGVSFQEARRYEATRSSASEAGRVPNCIFFFSTAFWRTGIALRPRVSTTAEAGNSRWSVGYFLIRRLLRPSAMVSNAALVL